MNDLHDSHVRLYRHHCKLRRAAELYAKPFKCAADGLPREILKGSRYVTVGAPDDEPTAPTVKPTLRIAK